MPHRKNIKDGVKRHYARPDLEGLIITALEKAGKDINNLEPEDLAPIDEFHIRGRKATVEMAEAVGLDEDKNILDIGSGIGGPSRFLALKYGCRVTGIDLTNEFCKVANMLAAKVGLSHSVKYNQGNALELEFSDETFDVVWTQHAAMNISDKHKLYAEAHRVLRPGGKLAIYDILEGPESPVFFPVPWARKPGTSFLATPSELRRLLQENGFKIEIWEDSTAEATTWFTKLVENVQENGVPPLGFHVLMGKDFRLMALNQLRNLRENRIVLLQVIAQK
ncbi:MAG: methyltransferase domain-containing protein [Balneolaceae bacterium]|jgi:ubiquinone/menaquinone biosynthesis C-methylase UbiE